MKASAKNAGPRAAVASAAFAALIVGVACASFRRGPLEDADGPELPDSGSVEDATSSPDASDASTTPVAPPDAAPDAALGRCANWPRADAAAPRVVVNEIQGEGTDWFELWNDSDSLADISSWMVADLDEGTGCPKLGGEQFVAPPGTTIAARSALIVLAGQANGSHAGPHTTCFPGAAPPCYYAKFGLSSTRGDALFLMQPGTAIVDEGQYPANAASSGRTWGRFPNATGAFASTASTPGATNTP